LIFDKNFDFWRKFFFWRKLCFLTKILIFDENIEKTRHTIFSEKIRNFIFCDFLPKMLSLLWFSCKVVLESCYIRFICYSELFNCAPFIYFSKNKGQEMRATWWNTKNRSFIKSLLNRPGQKINFATNLFDEFNDDLEKMTKVCD